MVIEVKTCIGGCGTFIPSACPHCKPFVMKCPKCGTENLIEPMSDPDDVAEAYDMLARRGLK